MPGGCIERSGLRWRVSRVLFPTSLRARGGDHSSGARVAAALEQPYPGASDGPSAPCSVLLRMGFADDPVARTARGLLPHGFTLTQGPANGTWAVWFLWHFPRGCPHRALPGILPCGARTFLRRVSPSTAACATGVRADCTTSGREGGPGQRVLRRRRRRRPRRRGDTVRTGGFRVEFVRAKFDDVASGSGRSGGAVPVAGPSIRSSSWHNPLPRHPTTWA